VDATSLKKALTHLKKDARLTKIVAQHKPEFTKGRDPFEALVRAIIYQQLSGKAAGTIHTRFLELYKKPYSAKTTKGAHPTPQDVRKTSLARLRSAGVSAQKAGYLHDLAAKFMDGTIEPKKFPKMTDEEIREHLIAVKGIGRWTADMFLMFTLHRPDVLPTGDLGIQKGMQKLFNLRKLPNPDAMIKLAKGWEPHRTVACWYVWKVIDTDA
jgi:DNA-3-methyladenine glycosylase II